MLSRQDKLLLFVRLVVVTVWIYNGLVLKILMQDPHHLAIVQQAIGFDASFVLRLIGLGETFIAIGVLSGLFKKSLAIFQIVVLLLMNIIGSSTGEIENIVSLFVQNIPFIASILVVGFGKTRQLRNTDRHFFVKSAAEEKILFGQMREDPEVELFLVSKLEKPQNLFAIASGGCTPFTLLTKHDASVYAVDISDAQIRLCELKKYLLREGTPENMLSTFDHDGRQAYEEIRLTIPSDLRAFFDENYDSLKYGVNNVGRIDSTLRILQKLVHTFFVKSAKLSRMLSAGESANRIQMFRDLHQVKLERIFRWLVNRKTVSLFFGRKVARHFPSNFVGSLRERIETALEKEDAMCSPYLRQTFLGHYDGYLPTYLQEKHRKILVSRLDQLSFQPADAIVWLRNQPKKTIDFFALSNILDARFEASEELAEAILHSARDGALICLRFILQEIPKLSDMFPSLKYESDLSKKAMELESGIFCTKIQVYRVIREKSIIEKSLDVVEESKASHID